MIRRLLTTVATALLLAGCAGQDAPTAPTDNPRPLTADEAERISLARFANYQRGRGVITGVIPHAGHEFHLTARVDWRDHRGYGTVHTAKPTGERQDFLLQWTPQAVAVIPGWSGGLPDQPPDTADWRPRPLDARHNPIDAALLMTLNLALDRPENAQLLAQSDARWLRSEHVGDTDLMVVSGPSPASSRATSDAAPQGRIRYWINGEGTMRRLTAPLGQHGDLVTLDLLDKDTPQIPPFTWR
ncbi:hypothetical protein ABZ816_25910 [Actinosynnema sp. NPDC047251]|uniref:Secreted protein n=1 Tax=Saccharothrix espanaensis (strain ATCC 51144 / DSM 44229 / JCM 9112 / NBRC 15066 / NRRL 15764) TaxID=1179773 RepID=K0JVF1_SACES|nr:hypothetical protein [Saccharothrix espanaensis]CCH31845.1 hypothetical protein BN6_45660 [Saccharothrix espanaensis DSM 44229]